jgi:hypothetical protein
VFIWQAVIHVLGIDSGLPYGTWSWYGFWSGVGGSFLVNLIAFSFLLWWRGTCHYSWKCLRRGSHAAAGGVFKLCWKHHPDLGVRPHHDLIHALHREWKTSQGAS